MNMQSTLFSECGSGSSGRFATRLLSGTTSHPIKAENDNIEWVDPLVDARKGRVRTSAGRMSVDEAED